MLTELYIKNLTGFSEARLCFGRNMNVFVGENGAGKSHLLKAAYCGLSVSAEGEKKTESATPGKEHLKTELARKLKAVFRPDRLGRIVKHLRGNDQCEIGYTFAESHLNYQFSFTPRSDTEVEVTTVPMAWVRQSPVFIPTRELLTLQPYFIPIYDEKYLPFEETWRDTSHLLSLPLSRARTAASYAILKLIEAALGGTVVSEQGRFYLETPTCNLEMYLLAEGMRKLAMIAQLVATGALTEKSHLFWDEPEANLNPKMIKVVARTILHLSQSGIQVFIATHSLFLLRELHILQSGEFPGLNTRYFGLHAGVETISVEDYSAELDFERTRIDEQPVSIGIKGITVVQGPTMLDIGDITALDEDIEQSDRYLDMAVKSARRAPTSEDI